MTATLLPNARQQFWDSNGRPLAGGSVYFYVPQTSTPKNTWQDAGQTVLNTNPVVLDANGQALIYGNGQYRQVAYDVHNNLIWDQLTSAPTTQADLSNTTDPTQGAGSVGFNNSLNYAAGTVGKWLKDLATSVGSSLIGFIQAIVGAIQRTVQDKLRDVVHVNDFGGNLKVALQNVPEYTTIVLAAATYDITGLFTSDFHLGAGPFTGNTKRGIRLQGAGMPRVADDGQSLIGGTVIQGTLLNLADGFEVYDLGVDVGKTVCTTKYAGAFAEGLILGLNPNYPSATTTIKGVKADRVIALGNVPTGDNSTWKHSVLCENLEGPRIGSITSVGGYHVYVDKCIGMQCGSVTALGGAGESVFFGANVGNACRLNQYGQIRIDSWFLNSVEQKAGGVVFNSNDAASPYLSKVKIGTLALRNIATGVNGVTDGGNSFITDCAIGHLDVDMGTGGAAFRMGYGSTTVQRFVIGSHNIVTAGRAFELGANTDSCHIGSGTQTFTADALNPLMAFNTLRYSHGRIQMIVLTGQTSTYMISRTQGDVFIDQISIGGAAGIPANRYLSSVQGSLALTSANFVDGGLVGQASNGARYVPYRVELTGSAKAVVAGTDLNLGTVSPPPRVNMRFIVPSETSPGVFVQRCLEITSAGVILARGSTANGEVITLNPVNYSLLV